MKACPHCAESMQDAAVVCPHCGRSLYRTRRIRIAVIVAVSLTTLAGAFCASVVNDVEEQWAAREKAAFRKSLGVLPPATQEEADRIIRQAIFRAAMREGVTVAAKRYDKTLDEVRAIVDEGTRAGWPRELR